MSFELRSFKQGIAWPALPSQGGATLLSLFYQLEQSQWWSAERLLEAQFRQLNVLLRHAWETVPWYRARLGSAGYAPGEAVTPATWRKLPFLSRRDAQSAGDALASRSVPAEYLPARDTYTTGSTGQPVKLRATQLDALLWEAMSLRDHAWHQRDFSGRLAAIRPMVGDAGAPPDGTMQESWGAPVDALFNSGPAGILSLSTDIATQAQWLRRWDPHYLVTFPNNLTALIEHFAAQGDRLDSLRAVATVSETLTSEVRAACRESWGVPVTDIYSSQEVGYIALQCPESGLYHVASESVYVEILDAEGKPCGPGEIGRVIVTSLHNAITPLIRYDLRDHAEVGAPCPCGRGLPTINRILGRSRNMVTLPDGSRHWPATGALFFRNIAPVRQCQFIQHARDAIEVRLAVERPLTADEDDRLRQLIQTSLGYPFPLAFRYYYKDEIPRGAGGKFEEFISLVEPV
jgi:phenylacetate-CoA ligase